MEDIFDIAEDALKDKKGLVLVIYDIVDNKRRNRLAKFLCGYGFRIQKSAFEMMINNSQYKILLKDLQKYAGNEDSIRVYKIVGYSELVVIGKKNEYSCEEVIIV